MAAGSLASRVDRVWRWITFAPALLLMAALGFLPIANLVYLSFHHIMWHEAAESRRFVGFEHYGNLAADTLFRAGLRNTAIFALCSVAAQMLIGFFLAVWCGKVRRGRVLYRTLFILPLLVPGIVIGAIWKLFLNPDFGLLNQFIDLVGFDPIDWLGDPATALLSVVIVDVWHWTPFCFLLLLAAVESLPLDVYEAAKIDGASGWRELLWITLPLMMPAIVVTALFRVVVAFKVFDEVYLLTGGGPGTATQVISFTIYQRFFTEDRVGFGSAMSITVIFLICLALVIALTTRRRLARAAA